MLFAAGDYISHAYVIVEGRVREEFVRHNMYNNILRVRHHIRSFLSYHHCVGSSFQALTTAIAEKDTIVRSIELSSIKNLMQSNSEFCNSVHKNSLYTLTQIYARTAGPLTYLSEV